MISVVIFTVYYNNVDTDLFVNTRKHTRNITWILAASLVEHKSQIAPLEVHS